MDSNTINILTQPLKVNYKPGPGGMKYKYVEGKDVISRLNSAFGHEWSSKVIETIDRDSQIITLVEVTAGEVTHQGYGGAEIARYSKGEKRGKPVDVSTAYKSSFTNAIKKCAEQFGIGLDSADSPKTTKDDYKSTANEPKTYGSTVIKNRTESNDYSNQSKTTQEDAQAKLVEEISNKVKNMISTDRPVVKPSAQSTAVYKPEEVRVPEPDSPFPEKSEPETKINDIQLNAIKGISRMKNITSEDLIKKALPNSTKTTYEELTDSEAKKIIPVLNNINNG